MQPVGRPSTTRARMHLIKRMREGLNLDSVLEGAKKQAVHLVHTHTHYLIEELNRQDSIMAEHLQDLVQKVEQIDPFEAASSQISQLSSQQESLKQVNSQLSSQVDHSIRHLQIQRERHAELVEQLRKIREAYAAAPRKGSDLLSCATEINNRAIKAWSQ